MRRCHQEQILNLLKMIQENHVNMKFAMFHKDNLTVQVLLQRCKQIVVQIIAFMEKDKKENTRVQIELKSYYELLNRLSSNVQRFNIIHFLQDHIEKISQGVTTELVPDKLEIVFLPYKACMFDCFESIWHAAQKNPYCDAYVMPIPYFDRSPDGSLGKLNYEGNQFPKDVPIVDCRTYKIEEHHPDIIFIHNPYDDTNYVTSVHPDFYCKRLKNFTDKLVFVPYFIGSRNQIAKEFVNLPGILYADKVFLQSESMRMKFIHYIGQSNQVDQCNGKFGEAKKKFVALGSPKLDKVFHTKKEGFLVPKEWKPFISTVPRKKIVLYNTSLNTILDHNEKYLEKLRRVLNLFRNQKDLILLWRPHPLAEITFRSMRPQLLEPYREIIKEYQKQGWGIYDNTPDPHKAIALSDAYYGDWSSLMPLFQCTGKPVVLQNPKLNLEKDSDFIDLPPLQARQFNIHCFVVKGKVVYLYDGATDGVFSLDLKTGRFFLETILPHSIQKVLGRGYIYMDIIGDCIFFAPCMASQLVNYDLKKKMWKVYDFVINEAANAGLRYCCIWKDKVFFVPLNTKDFIWLDLRKNKVERYSKWLQGYFKKAGIFSGAGGLPFLLKNKLYIPHRNPWGVVEFDCEAMKVVALHPLKNCVTLTYDGTWFWWANHNGLIYKWNKSTGESHLVCDLTTLNSSRLTGIRVYFLTYTKGYLLALPHQYHPHTGCKAYKIKTDTGQVQEVPELGIQSAPQVNFNKNLICYCDAKVLEDGNIYTYCNAKNIFIRINLEDNEFLETPVILDVKNIYQKIRGFAWEGPAFSLKHYLNALTQAKSIKEWEQIKECTLSINIVMKQMVQRQINEGDADFGINIKNGNCGQRILDCLLNECGIGGKKK